MKRFLLAAVLCLAGAVSYAQDLDDGTGRYVAPVDPLVQANVEKWQDLKFGMFIHWGTYSQLGIIESWSLCPQPISWMMRRPQNMSWYEYFKYYESLQTKFNPVDFDPDKWAAAAEYAGMKYVMFTTKHHDGFCMFDTKATDYKITSEACPFHTNPKANIAKEVFDAFRARGIRAGAYFSIADWHHEDYWWQFITPKDRYVNYPVADFPEKWARFEDFVVQQMDELTDGTYGPLDILWFDLCNPVKDGSADVPWKRMEEKIRGNQPGTIMVARGTANGYEDYLTPEQCIPKVRRTCPWESCITMSEYSWSYRPGVPYKSTKEILDILVKVVAGGGNLLLNVGPRPDGTLEDEAYERLREIGDWMQVNGEAIYGTKAYEVLNDGKVYFTIKGSDLYAFYVADPDEQMPAQISFRGVVPASAKAVSMLGVKRPLKWHADGKGGLVVDIPEAVRNSAPCKYTWCLKIDLGK